jgi:hypothetical protein
MSFDEEIGISELPLEFAMACALVALIVVLLAIASRRD